VKKSYELSENLNYQKRIIWPLAKEEAEIKVWPDGRFFFTSRDRRVNLFIEENLDFC